MTESAAVRACRHALMTAALHGDTDLMADLHRELDHLLVLRRLVPEQRSGDEPADDRRDDHSALG